MDRKTLRTLIKEHGEAHVYIEEHEAVVGSSEAIGIRDNDNYQLEPNYVEIDTGGTKQYVLYDRIVHVELPVDFPD